ncbi:MAG: DUF4433 domain-containing protein [Verrucomicrobiota bacterium]|jgi:hypothetical protein|nr:DUF4433 domain-containing protein [Verrucomicrobiota bacterium]
MSHPVPYPLNIYHIVHIDKLASILEAGRLVCDAGIQRCHPAGTTIGMGKIKQRRLEKQLNAYPDLHVGDCVPFYFCPRSVMLYMFWMDNHPEIDYHGGQEPIVHLVSDFHSTIAWAEQNSRRWVFTNSNAGSGYFDDFCSEEHLPEINWNAVCARNWQEQREQKQAEFLIESEFPWTCVEKIGVFSEIQRCQVESILSQDSCLVHRPPVCVERAWYY